MSVDDGRSYYIQTAWRWAGNEGNETRLRSRITLSLDDAPEGVDGVVLIAMVETERVDRQDRTVGLANRTFSDWLELLDRLEEPS